MPIQFRCHRCGQVLSISTKKAGTTVACPACREPTQVPTLADVERAERLQAQEVVPSERVAPPAAVADAPQEPEVESDPWRATARERNPWIDEEADAEEDFRINRPGLVEAGLDMTPMVDVTFLLLIFFMITASFSIQKSMQADPPQPDDEGAAQSMTIQELEQDSILVGVSAQDELTVDDEPIGGLGALADALRAKIVESGGQGVEMTIEADPACSFGMMVGVMDTGITVGMQRIRRVSRAAE
jgi:biopolymer transport protein ExbD